MKSSVPWLLISSAITLPLSSIIAAEDAVVEVAKQKVSQPQNGNVSLGPTDSYPGSGSNGAGFTYKETSNASGTIYTLTGDVSISNVTTTQAPASNNQSQAQSEPTAESIEENGRESQNGKSSNEKDKEAREPSSSGEDHSGSEDSHPSSEESRSDSEHNTTVSESSRTEGESERDQSSPADSHSDAESGTGEPTTTVSPENTSSEHTGDTVSSNSHENENNQDSDSERRSEENQSHPNTEDSTHPIPTVDNESTPPEHKENTDVVSNPKTDSEGDGSTIVEEHSESHSDTENSASSDAITTESNSITNPTETTENSNTDTVTAESLSSAKALRADANISDVSNSESSSESHNGNQSSQEGAQSSPKSCFLNTVGPLTFIGKGNSLTFNNITITAKGAAINNSAGSTLTLSEFNNLSFTNSTNQTQDQADSAIYVGPKAASGNGGVVPGVGGVPGAVGASGNSVHEGASESEVAASLWRISSETSSDGNNGIGVVAAEGAIQNDVVGDAGAESVVESSPAIILKGNVNITFSGNSSKKAGGAINVDGGSATIENNTGTCTFSNNNAKEQGGAISVNGDFNIIGNNSVIFSDNKAAVVPAPTESPERQAVAIVSDQSVQAPVTGTGGAIYCLSAPVSVPGKNAEQPKVVSAEGVLPSIQAISLSADSTPKAKQGEADPTPAADPCVNISGNTSVTFDNNSSTTSGGAIHTKKLVLSSGGNITFSSNSSGKGGAIFITDSGDISITAATGSITFQGNTVTAADIITIPAKSQAGAENSASDGSVSSNGQADVAQANSVQPEKVLVAFSNFANKAEAKVDAKAKVDQNQKPSHNAIHLGSGATISQLRAGTGQTIFFYDPITTTKPVAAGVGSAVAGSAVPSGHSIIVRAAAAASPGAGAAATPKTPLKINAPDEPAPSEKEAPIEGVVKQATTYNGTIVFSGEKLSTEDAKNPLNALSVFNTDVSLEAGTLVLRRGAGLLVDSFIQQTGSLIIMDGGTSIITNVPASNPITKVAEVPAVLKNVIPVVNAFSKPDPKVISQLVASSLMNFKQRGPLAAAPAVPAVQNNPDGSIVINNLAVNLDSLGEGKMITLAATGTGNVTLTGDLKFQDSSQNFYDNPLLNKNFSANILDISTATGGQVNTEGFNMIPQGSTSSNVGYQGNWEVVKKEENGKTYFELKWISAGYTPTPNRRASLVPNSLWCSAIDIRAIQQLVEVSTQGEDFHKGIWISGISNFFHRDSMKVQKGFRHISSGYAVGLSAQPITDKVIDIAFCQMFGKSKDYYLAKTRSHIYAASIHTKREKLLNHYKLSNKKGSIFTKLPEQIPVIFDAQLSYSLSHNSMTTKQTPKPSSRGKWNNHCVAGELGSYLPITIDNPIIEELSPFVKLNVVFVQQEDFKETKGGDANRNFQSAHFVNISLPIGIKFENINKYNIYNISLIYQPDIYRDAPKSKVFLPSVNTSWSTGATNLARQALILDGSNHHHLTDNFEVFCHGAFELRGSSRNYNLDLGGRYKF
ncbi:Pmp family polymorphic membrane protein autotransporter adhesin [Chlamydia sp. 12-01]|uniref:polymorphic outer membrane protein middle domain-containing protein n=1 Tax=Chlamydia sp. 12-01 TaxID=3002742 RepID=UPI0035D41C4D